MDAVKAFYFNAMIPYLARSAVQNSLYHFGNIWE